MELSSGSLFVKSTCAGFQKFHLLLRVLYDMIIVQKNKFCNGKHTKVKLKQIYRYSKLNCS